MKNEEMQKFTNTLREKLGEENSALIADDLGTLITDTSNMNSMLEKQTSTINELKADKENLIKVNGNLLQQVSMGEDFTPNNSKKEEKEKEPFSFKSVFDEKGNFID